MNADSENFEELRKLLVLKRYEQPPPGYFNRLPGQIIARIELLEEEPGFWQRLISGFVLRPAQAYALGLTFCGAIIGGVVYSVQVTAPELAAQPIPAHAWDFGMPSATLASQNSQLPQIHVAGFIPSTNVETESLPSLFGPGFGPHVAPVSYTIGGH